MLKSRQVWLALCAALWPWAAAALDLSEQEQAGRRIYLAGESPSGARIGARIGMGGLELSGTSVACGNCHGEDGRGRAEGGVVPSDIRWSELTKPYGHRHANGRSHAAFDEALLQRAVMEGLDPGGNRLDGAMPRYAMSARDFAALAAYLRKLETVLDPGLDAQTIRIGTLLPAGAPGAALRALLEAQFAALNARGGIHGRRLELVARALPAAGGPLRVRELLDEDAVFALLAPFSAGIEADLAEAATAARVPVIGPLTLFPEDRGASNPYVFHLLPGVGELAQLLLQHAAQEPGLARRPVALWHADSQAGREGAEALAATLGQTGWSAPLPVAFPARGASHDALARALKARDVAAVVVLGVGAELTALAEAAARIGWAPYLLLPGPLAPRDILALPADFRERVVLAYPSVPADRRREAVREFDALLGSGGEARAGQPLLIAAYGAGTLLAEALKRSGRELTRRKLVATLEGVQGFDSGLLPPLSYNADRRIGALGGYLLALDFERKGLRPLGGYRRLQ